MRDEYIASWCVGGQLQGFCTQIGDGLAFVHLHSWECLPVEAVAHRKTVAGAKSVLC